MVKVVPDGKKIQTRMISTLNLLTGSGGFSQTAKDYLREPTLGGDVKPWSA